MTQLALDTQQLTEWLKSRDNAAPWLASVGITNARAAFANLTNLAEAVPLDLLAIVLEQFTQAAPTLADPDMALNNLERFILSARSPLSMAALFERDAATLKNLLLILNTSQHLSDQLCTDPESYDLLRMTEGRPVARDLIVQELVGEVRSLKNRDDVIAALRRFKRRETLRIAYGDIVLGVPVEQITRQISYVADATVEAALDFALRKISTQRVASGASRQPPPRFVVLALGKLGGLELNYSSDIDLVFLYQAAETSALPPQDFASSFSTAVARELIQLLSESTSLGFSYRVDMRLRPEGQQGPLCTSVDSALGYYDLRGRTWERQAYVKARPCAGDIALGLFFLQRLEPWVYSRYLSLTDITGIKALKRRIEKQASEKQAEHLEVKTGPGGIRDIEFVIQFLQLLNGGALETVRTGNTLEAITRLENAGSLTNQESTMLTENYRYLRKLEHRLQIMYDLQTHQLPQSDGEQTKLARRMGFVDSDDSSALEEFRRDYAHRTVVNRKMLDHLLHDAFGDDAATEPEVDLVNDPAPPPELIAKILGKYPFAEPLEAYSNLMSLAEERIPFLSTRRCRMFLASIAPRLLAAIARTPDPAGTLVNLSRVSDSLGGKAALWELFSGNPATLNLYVTLCAASPYLSGILTSNPGMIDELLDSLLLKRLPSLSALEAELAELTRGAEDKDRILHSFKASQHLRVGVRDILGKDEIQDTHAELSDIAEVCLCKIADLEIARLMEKRGVPSVGSVYDPADKRSDADEFTRWNPPRSRAGSPCEFIVLALGKLGGREPNYHSDLDLMFVYEADGVTICPRRDSTHSTSNSHFFSELGQRIIKRCTEFGPSGRLFEVDSRLRPTGRSGSLAVSLPGLVRYFQEGGGQLWERLALCKARVVVGTPAAAQRAMAAVKASTYCKPWQPSDAAELRQMRLKMQETATNRNLKRGPGGTVDTEFIVQMLQLKHGQDLAGICLTSTPAALRALQEVELIPPEVAAFLLHAYSLQRRIEARIRLMDSSGRHEFPEDPLERAKLAFLMGESDPEFLATTVFDVCRKVREIFDEMFSAAERE